MVKSKGNSTKPNFRSNCCDLILVLGIKDSAYFIEYSSNKLKIAEEAS